MAKLVVLLSGSVSSGKSTLAQALASDFGFTLVKTWELLRENSPDTNLERAALQELGEKLDKETGGAWVSDALARKLSALNDDAMIVVDAVRIEGQIEAVRKGLVGLRPAKWATLSITSCLGQRRRGATGYRFGPSIANQSPGTRRRFAPTASLTVGRRLHRSLALSGVFASCT